MSLNEADTRAQLIDPKLNNAGWTRSQVTREQYYQIDWNYTAGKIVLRGSKAERQSPRRVDYLLRYTNSFPIAVVEAKEESKPAVSGLEQVKNYAHDLGLAFAYTTNGREIIEWDAFTDSTRNLDAFPSPDELWKRWQLNTGLSNQRGMGIGSGDLQLKEIRPLYNAEVAAQRKRNPLLHPYAPTELTRGKTPHYYQERAVKEVILRAMRGQQRILLTMATGTGKTHTALQITWKLIKSGWLYNRQAGVSAGRILFLADRVVLRDQAYNAFGPFAADSNDPRLLLEGAKNFSLNRDLYFAIYQNMWSTDRKNKRLYQKFPQDFFDLIIIDEAHRSGFGTWREILDYFGTAIHLGMTATPKQDENIDTYAYFCAEEPAIPLDIEKPEKGYSRPAAFTYSLGQGIEDGFLATYKIHRVRTNLDKNGLTLGDIEEQGAEVSAPEGSTLKDSYHTTEFEREIVLPDRTAKLVEHLVGLLRQFGPTQKTMVFCVNISHAQEVARLLNNAFNDLGFGDNYAVPIVSEEGERGQRWLQQFQDSDKILPVVATTAELLSTGVDVPAARNIVFMKTISSPIVFKQIIGRGTRIDSDSGKLWFRIIDYTNATRLLDSKWDTPPLPVTKQTANDSALNTAVLTGTARLASSNESEAAKGPVLVGVSVTVQVGVNDRRGPTFTDENGSYLFEKLPSGQMTLEFSGPSLSQKQVAVVAIADQVSTYDVELKRLEKRGGKITVAGLTVTIADEAIFMVDGIGEPMSLQQYLDYTRSRITGIAADRQKLRAIWQDPEQRKLFLKELRRASVQLEPLTELLSVPSSDQFDIICGLAFDTPIRSRHERVVEFKQRETAWLDLQAAQIREVLLALLDKYELAGLEEMTSPEIFRVSPFREMGSTRGVLQRFNNDPRRLREMILELQRRLYAA